MYRLFIKTTIIFLLFALISTPSMSYADADSITWDTIRGENISQTEVTTNLNLVSIDPAEMMLLSTHLRHMR